jgi:hypothetical protein
MWAVLKRGTVWEEKLTLAKEPSAVSVVRITSHIITHNTRRVHVKIESGTQIASRGPTSPIATPRY